MSTQQNAPALVFMNHRIRDENPRWPVIRVQYPDGRIEEGNLVEILDPAGAVVAVVRYQAKPHSKIDSHDVRAYIKAPNVRVIPWNERQAGIGE